jgi:Tol biopolymer transport system component
MELRTKKILAIIAFLGSIFLFGWLIYYFFFKPAPSEITNVNETLPTGEFPPTGTNVNIPVVNRNINGQLPTANVNINAPVAAATQKALGGVTKTQSIVPTPTQDAKMANNGREIAYYDKSDNSFYKIDQTGKIKKLSDKKFYNVKKATWSPDVSKAIIEYPDNSKIMYDFQKQKQYTIPKHWEGFDFSPDGKQIVTKSMGIDPEMRWLAISNADGSQAKRIEPMGENYAKVNPTWSPTGQIIATYAEGKDLNRQNVYLIGKNNENFKSLLVEGRGFESQWSPTGSHLLYSVYNTESGYRPTLWITEATGERIGVGRKPLKLNTWAHKCTFGSTTKIYCAVPESLEEGSGLFPEIANSTPDNLYEINLTTGTKKLIAIPEDQTTMQNIMVSSDGRYLYFTDANTGKISKINLK